MQIPAVVDWGTHVKVKVRRKTEDLQIWRLFRIWDEC